MDADSKKASKNRKTKDGHIIIVTDRTKLMQPYQYRSSNANEAQSLDNVQSQKLKRTDAGHHFNSSLQSSDPCKPASLPAIITENKTYSLDSAPTAS
jgi:hypothetical protein